MTSVRSILCLQGGEKGCYRFPATPHPPVFRLLTMNIASAFSTPVLTQHIHHAAPPLRGVGVPGLCPSQAPSTPNPHTTEGPSGLVPVSSHLPHLCNRPAASKGLAQQTHHPAGPVASEGTSTPRNKGSCCGAWRGAQTMERRSLHTRATCFPATPHPCSSQRDMSPFF